MDYLSILQKNINKNFNDLIYKKLFGKNYDIIKIRDINKMEDFEKYKGDAYYINNKIFILENKKKVMKTLTILLIIMLSMMF